MRSLTQFLERAVTDLVRAIDAVVRGATRALDWLLDELGFIPQRR